MKRHVRTTIIATSVAALTGVPVLFAGCDKVESSSKTKTEKVVETPEGKKKVTETTETTKTTEDK